MTPLSGRRSQARRGAAAIEAEITNALHQLNEQHRIDRENYRRARAEEEANRRKYGRDDLTDARAVRTRTGWHSVISLNRTTVTVPGPWGDTMRVTFDQIREVRS